MKSYTDIEQSKKLAEILPLESADMVYFGIHQGMDGKYHLSGTNTEDDVVPIYKNFCIKVFAKITESDVINQLPCWSLAALLSVLPKEIEIDGQHYAPCLFPVKSKWLLKLWYNSNYTITSPIAIFSDNLVDAYVEMILKLKEKNLL